MLSRNNLHWPGASQFLRDERGTVTIESVLWLPVFVIILVAATDATVLYLHHTEMWNVSRDVARRVSVGDMTEADAAATVQNEMFLYSSAYTVATSDPADLDVQIVIQTSVADASVFGFFDKVICMASHCINPDGSVGKYLTAIVTMRREPI